MISSFLPDWAEPVLRYMFEVGLRGTLQIAALSLTGSLLIGVTLGTLLTIKFKPSRALIRLYIEVWRGLPILVTLFLVFFLLPAVDPKLEFDALISASIARASSARLRSSMVLSCSIVRTSRVSL